MHTCTFVGAGAIVPCSSGSRLANGKEREEGQCRSYTFDTKSVPNKGEGVKEVNGVNEGSCTNGVPGSLDANPDQNCMVSVREFVQCGSASDLETAVSSSGLNIQW